MANQIRTCFAIFIGSFSQEEWFTFQNNFPMGPMRFLLAENAAQAAQHVTMLRESMNCPERFAAQTDYFNACKAESVSAETAREIGQEILLSLGISEEDASITMEAFPSLCHLIGADLQALPSCLPVSQDTIAKLNWLLDASKKD